METIRFRKWDLHADAAATRAAYAAAEIGWAEFCGCPHCRNFVLARETVYPPELVRLLADLGIDPKKESEVYPYRRIDDRSTYYAGWFHFVGSINAGPDYWAEDPEGGLCTNPEGSEFLGEEFRMGFTRRVTRVRRPFREEDVAQLEWVAPVPWLLERKMPFRD